MYRILTLNNISVKGLDRLPRERFETSSDIAHPDAVMVRSADLHEREIPDSVLAVGRAGAGVNNVPVAELTNRGVPVFNAPGANANAVKELTIAGMLIAARNICPAWEYARNLKGSDEQLHEAMEANKKNYVGFELPGRTLGIVGLGAIGVKVANSARALGMNVVGYDPQITVDAAWQLDAGVESAHSVGDVMARSDIITVHVPLVEATRGLIDASRLAQVHEGATLLNFSRSEVVEEADVIRALDEGRLRSYVCDFPSNAIKDHPKVVTLPHLGASTLEAQENCAIMVADQLREYLELGNIRNAVNFPDMSMPRGSKGDRLCVVNANVPNMLGQISGLLAQAGLNIDDMFNKAREKLAYTLVDVEGSVPDSVVEQLSAIDGVLKVRVLR
ncbi:D-3-phosphoglycerate dehydrogenase [Halorhodospira halochloris]|uniref:D-3-phosphoglycerate dehydrogenase n=1 Tax=Halorhodospira halochloris TaxID=1052 RepID=A0A0X8XBW8_HALHR|nr:phosphoglycerate dehydrogenase [Halorhodospira halochloris]MBK1651488.1 3-phosphoglycerate dehydrogenase [Halorhodospira halochloris]MCG5548022.1 phosphoglycerate dehydrogenase [Halorhodospira halochloris]BAU57249.2 D-3-phosphoglycerate dehydrogenase [Halorhodospira halochloris]